MIESFFFEKFNTFSRRIQLRFVEKQPTTVKALKIFRIFYDSHTANLKTGINRLLFLFLCEF